MLSLNLGSIAARGGCFIHVTAVVASLQVAVLFNEHPPTQLPVLIQPSVQSVHRLLIVSGYFNEHQYRHYGGIITDVFAVSGVSMSPANQTAVTAFTSILAKINCNYALLRLL